MRPSTRAKPADLLRVLVVDDEPLMRGFLEEALRREGCTVQTRASGEEALTAVANGAPDLALLDVRLGGMDGLTLLGRLRETCPHCTCIMMTAHGTVETAVRAMQQGASEFLLKPFSVDTLRVVIKKTAGVVRLREENRRLRAELQQRAAGPQLIGRSAGMVRLIELVRTLAEARATVLITGESGTGKELVAQALHAWGPRAGAPFIKLNCAALPGGLMESELFGHEKGAFTGASGLQRGKFEMADGGILLLDEISEMELALQPKLLRCLQEKEFYRVGGSRPLRIDARIVATTNAELEERVAAGRFRADLLYRLNVVPLRVPPLRERREDIPLLVRHFLVRAAAENNRPVPLLAPATLHRLLAHDWPGNVRELENVIARAVVICPGGEITTEHLLWEGAPTPLAAPAPAVTGALRTAARVRVAGDGSASAQLAALPPDATLREVERAWILATLEQEGGNRTRTARRLGISVRTIRNKLRAYLDAQPARAA